MLKNVKPIRLFEKITSFIADTSEISEIEELEQEPLRGEKQQFLPVERVMNTLA